jgi:hypothetical protein
MEMQYYLSPKRFWHLLKLELTRNARGIGMAFVVTFGLLFFVSFLLSLIVDGNIKSFQHQENYAFGLLISGMVLTSFAFHDLGSPIRRHIYLMLPASTLEKFVCMLFLTSVGWVILFTIAYTGYTFLANPVGQMLFSGVRFESFNPFDENVFTSIKFYLILQGVFLVGAANFRGYALLKTIFVLVVVALIAGTVVYFLLKDTFLTDHDCDGSHCELIDVVGAHTVWNTMKFFFWWILAPLCWVLTYIGLKDQEV